MMSNIEGHSDRAKAANPQMDPAIGQTFPSALGQCGEAIEDKGRDASYALESLLDILALIALKPIVEGLEADAEHFCGA